MSGTEGGSKGKGRKGGYQPDVAALDEYRTAIRDTTRLNRLFAILSDPAPLGVVIDRAILALSEMFAADVVALLEPAGPGGLAPLGIIGLPEEASLLPFSAAESGYPAEAIAARAPVLVSNALGDPRMDPQLSQIDVQSAVWLPILASQGVLGILVLGRCQPLPFSRADADLVMTMGHRIGLVLDRAKAEEERARLEARLHQAEKAESLGRMAAAIAHHFNNKLTAVMGSLDLALDELAEGRDARVEIGHAQEATRQASLVSRLMLAYLGQSFHVRQVFDLVAACREALRELTRTQPATVHIRTSLPDRPIMVKGSAVDIRQVLENLVVNAGEAMAGAHGDIFVSVREVRAADVVPSPVLSPGWTVGAGPYVCLEVSDPGSGMDPETIQNAFDPFFTTKFTGRGLGLPVALGIVRAHEGTVTVSSEPGRGSTFRVFLPVDTHAEAQVPEPGL